MSKIQKLELTWVGKNEQEEIEPRILVENPELSHVYNTSKNGQMTFCDKDGNFDNMLIHGDNLLALKALEQDFAGQVKCIYIDPPYNTGSAFEHYDDNLEHSIWLNLMNERLKLLKVLLKKDGVIFIQIGYDEMAYLKVLCDEIFGRDNCIGQVAVRMSHSAGMKRNAMDKRLIKNTEYILVYYNEEVPVLKPLYEICSDYPVNYYHYINKEPNIDSNKGSFINLVDVLYDNLREEFQKFDLKKSNKSIDYLFKNSKKVQQFIYENANKIVRKDSNAPTIDENTDIDVLENEFFELKLNRENVYNIGKNAKGNYFQLYRLSDKLKEIDEYDEDGNLIKVNRLTNLVGDWWGNFYKDMSRVDIEGNVKMKTSKKPERLIKWVLDLCSQENDLILDSFLGSGTTCAVAHKMGRKWIGIEMGEHAYTLSKVRIDAVVDGEQSGISKAVNWQGGGSYKFYELAPSLVIKDSHGREIINPEYNANMLAAAMAKHEGFKYSPDKENVYKQGFASEKSFIFTTTTHLTAEYLDEIAEHFTDEEFLVINCKSFDGNISNNYKNIKIKKIPQSILGKCVFGKDNYNLNIINLPTEEGADEEN